MWNRVTVNLYNILNVSENFIFTATVNLIKDFVLEQECLIAVDKIIQKNEFPVTQLDFKQLYSNL